MIRKLFTTLILLALLCLGSFPLGAYSCQGYVKLYNYTEADLQVWIDGSNVGTIPTGYSPNWIPAQYGLHKVEVYKAGCYRSAYKYCEVSYSYPNAQVEIGKYDL